MTGGEDGATFGGRTFFSDEAIEERFKKSEDSFEEFKKECRDSFKAMQDSLAEMAKTAGTTVDGEPGETTKEPSGEGKPDKDIEGGLKEEAPPGNRRFDHQGSRQRHARGFVLANGGPGRNPGSWHFCADVRFGHGSGHSPIGRSARCVARRSPAGVSHP